MIKVIILKLTEVCNLNCSYCYMFNSEDKTYTRVPKLMPMSVGRQVLSRIKEYLDEFPENRLRIVLHGGEPGLWPKENFTEFLEEVHTIRSATRRLSLGLQTNLFEYDRELLGKIAQVGGSVGVSLDGPQAYNDAVRMTHSAKGSYAQISENLQQLERDGFMPNLGGILSVANPDIPPQEYLDWVKTLPKKHVSILWPIHYNYDTPPQRDYGGWYAELFRLWAEEDDASVQIRFFKDAIKRTLGCKDHGDSIGNDALESIVINTDGQYERHDYLRYFSDGLVRTEFNVSKDSIAAAANDEIIRQCSDLRAYLPLECLECIHADVCGGGFIANRFTKQSTLSFSKKSVMCEDHKRFFDAVKAYLD